MWLHVVVGMFFCLDIGPILQCDMAVSVHDMCTCASVNCTVPVAEWQGQRNKFHWSKYFPTSGLYQVLHFVVCNFVLILSLL